MPLDLTNKTYAERVSLKSDAIVEVAQTGKYNDKATGIEVEVISVEKIEGGVQVLARAWKDGKQLGFGDGSVDIERFRIFNPPVMVPDGTKKQVIDQRTGNVVEDDNMVEDPFGSLKKDLVHTILLVGKESSKIKSGKIGSTTSTFNPSIDGYVDYNNGSGVTFSSLRTSAGNASDSSSSNSYIPYLDTHTSTDKYDDSARGVFEFNTSAIPDTDTISSAVFSLYGSGTINTLTGGEVVIDRRVLTTQGAIANGDYNIAGWDGVAQSDTRIAVSSWASAYNDFTLNATGIANISKTGYTYLGTRIGWDFDNSAPTWSSNVQASTRCVMANNGTNQPKLVVTHAAGATDTSSFFPFLDRR